MRADRLHWRMVAFAAMLLGWWMVSPAGATVWINEFTDFTGTNAAAVSNYNDTGGGNPLSYMVTYDGMGAVTQAGPWLQQGDLGGGNRTAKLFNEPGTGNGRVRFSTALPASMDLDEGFSVSWRMRVGAANAGRGPIQVAATASGTGDGSSADAFNAYIRLRNSGDVSGNSIIDIQRNGGGLYSALSGGNDQHRVDTLVLPANLADQYHEWQAFVIRNPDDNKAYWKLLLDNQLLLFGGPSGAPVLDGEQFSFRTFQEGFTGASYIGLGDLNSQDVWDFEFDYVSFSDVPEPVSLALLAVGACVLVRRRR